MSATPDLAAHKAFLEGYYGWSHKIYDVTRAYYLLGRDRALKELAAESWRTLVEIGPGTGRNLRHLRKLKPGAALGGVEPCEAMREHAAAAVPGVKLIDGFAETADLASVHGVPPDRVLFSYALSMIQQPGEALDRALAQLAPGGEVVVVDFADLNGLPGPAATALRAWLRAFHVAPLDATPLVERGARITWGPGRYYLIARLRPGGSAA
jgi:S-adenosylmethionine-diacylgycerolhomoserine-N-methlytransferase